jgi:signal peptidase I
LDKNSNFLKTLKVKFIEKKGDSMFPTLLAGDKLLLEPIDKKNIITNGSLICFAARNDKKLVVHRVIKIKGEKIFIKGDNRIITDSPRKKTEVIALVVAIKRGPHLLLLNSFWGKFYSRLFTLLLDKKFYFINNFISKREKINRIVYSFKLFFFRKAYLLSWKLSVLKNKRS